MEITLLLSAYFFHSFSLVSAQCSLFSVSDCRLVDNEIINEIPLPINQVMTFSSSKLIKIDRGTEVRSWTFSRGFQLPMQLTGS